MVEWKTRKRGSPGQKGLKFISSRQITLSEALNLYSRKNLLNWRMRAQYYLKKYAKKLGIEPPKLVFFKGRTRQLGAARNFRGEVVTYSKDGKVKSKKKIEPTIMIAEVFDKLFRKNPEKADRLLRFTIAHELGHIKNPWWGPSKTAEEIANKIAEELTGISTKQHVKEVFEMIPPRKKEDLKRILKAIEEKYGK